MQEWAKKQGISPEIASMYQMARRNWMNRLSSFNRRFGGNFKNLGTPEDIRSIRKLAGYDINEFLESKIIEIKSRSSVATKWIKEKQQQYMANVLTALEESSETRDNVEVEEFRKWLNEHGNETATMAKAISDISDDGGLKAYYSDGEVTFGAGQLLQSVKKAVL